MRFIIIPVVFVTLILLPGISPADPVGECRTNCAAGSEADIANCPPAGEDTAQIRNQCLQDIQNNLKDCLDACPQAASEEEPKDVPADEPKNTEEKPIDATPIPPAD